MNDLNNLPKELPEKTYTFEVEKTGEITNQAYKGTFTFEIPSLKVQAQISKHEALLNNGLGDLLDIGTKNLHYMISYLRYALCSMPQWWIDADYGYALYDANVIEEVYAKSIAFENEWMEKIWGKSSKKRKTK